MSDEATQGTTRDIRVGDRVWSSARWAAVIQYFLDKVWSGEECDEIVLGTIHIVRPGKGQNRYRAYGVSEDALAQLKLAKGEYILMCSCRESSIEGGLIRFAKSEKLRQLRIRFDHGYLFLWKTENKGELKIYGTIPATL
jgi:hypothetical protein